MVEEVKKKRPFKTFSYRGVDLDQLVKISQTELKRLFPARLRRKLNRGLKRKPQTLLRKLRRAKKEAGPLEKPAIVKTHLRNMIILPEMVGSIVGVYNGRVFNQVEIKVNWCSISPIMILIWVTLQNTNKNFPLYSLTGRNDRTLLGRIFDHLQASQTRKTWYWCHPLF